MISCKENSANDLEYNKGIWNQEIKKHNMKLNKEKSKVMVIGENNTEKINIYMDGVKLGQLNFFKYLGVITSRNGEHDADIENRMEKQWDLPYNWEKPHLQQRSDGVPDDL